MIDGVIGTINAADSSGLIQFSSHCEIEVPWLVVIFVIREEQRDELLSRLGAPSEWIVNFPDQCDCGVFLASEEGTGPFTTELDIIEKKACLASTGDYNWTICRSWTTRVIAKQGKGSKLALFSHRTEE